MTAIHIILPIIIGAAIGYFTNFIAIKMLFHPRKPVHIGSMKLPLTPGVIPKNQERIARATGAAVGSQLLTAEDLAEMLKTSEAKEAFVNKASDIVDSLKLTEQAPEYIYGALSDAVTNMDLLPMMRKIADLSIGEFLQNPMLAMFLNESMMDNICVRMADSTREYVCDIGRSDILKLIEEKTGEFMQNPGDLEQIAGTVFDTAVIPYAASVLEQIDISRIVEDKVNAMDVDELEKLVMSVMKNELQTIINLGALIGAIIGVINIFI